MSVAVPHVRFRPQRLLNRKPSYPGITEAFSLERRLPASRLLGSRSTWLPEQTGLRVGIRLDLMLVEMVIDRSGLREDLSYFALEA